MRVAACLIVVMSLGSVPPALSQEAEGAFVDHLIKQLSCKAAPDPTAILLYLNKYKRIALDDGTRIDSETCWSIRPALDVRGAGFTHICASAEDPLLIELFPRLYYRAPGTSAGTGLRLVTAADSTKINDWIKQTLGNDDDAKLEVGRPSFVEGETEISCNSHSFPTTE